MTKQVSIAAVAALLLAVLWTAPLKAQSPAPATPQTPVPSGQSGIQPAAAPTSSAAAQQSPTAPSAQKPQSSQNPNPQNQQDEYVIRRSVNEVNLIFTVTDRHGHFVKNLQQQDFALLDDQKAPAKVSSFTQQTNLPLRVGILIDASTSIRTRFEFEQQASIEFLLQTLTARSDRSFVMGFDVTPYLMQDWTNNLDLLETGINKLRPGGGTALFDAVYTACRDKLLDSSRGVEPVRKAMVLISDGDDNQSRAYLDDAIKMCQRASTIIYTISTNTSPTRGRGDAVLQKMSEETGGVTFFPQRIEDIAIGFKNIEDELRSQYALTYTPSDFDTNGAFRTIYLVALDRKYLVRAPKGYFATK
jgi:Ca-activated chloride channel homolog